MSTWGCSALNPGDAYEKERTSFHPRLVVANLANNDLYPDKSFSAFRQNIDRLININRRTSIGTILACEPNWPGKRPSAVLPKHGILKDIGAQYGIPVDDLQEFLRTYQSFLWWDFVHLTSFGQELVAEYFCRLSGTDGKRMHLTRWFLRVLSLRRKAKMGLPNY